MSDQPIHTRKDTPLPRVTLQLEGMTQRIVQMLTEQHLGIEEHVEAALKRVCSAEGIRRHIEVVAEIEVNKAITEAVQRHYRYGKGSSQIIEAVIKRLEEEAAFAKGMNPEDSE